MEIQFDIERNLDDEVVTVTIQGEHTLVAEILKILEDSLKSHGVLSIE